MYVSGSSQTSLRCSVLTYLVYHLVLCLLVYSSIVSNHIVHIGRRPMCQVDIASDNGMLSTALLLMELSQMLVQGRTRCVTPGQIMPNAPLIQSALHLKRSATLNALGFEARPRRSVM